MLTNEREDSLKLFFYLASTTDQKEKINKLQENVQLHPNDCLYENFTLLSRKGETFFGAGFRFKWPTKKVPCKGNCDKFFQRCNRSVQFKFEGKCEYFAG